MPETLHRPPAIPLVTIDPYTSVWCCADRLTDDWSRHWTGTLMPLYAVVRVEGVAYRVLGGPEWLARAGEQVALDVSATTTAARFRCGAVEIGLSFTTPLLVDDLDLMSRPVTYVTFTARSLDARARPVECYFDMTGALAVDRPHDRVVWDRHEREGVTALAFRHEHQPILETAGDHRRIDWGTAYLAGATARVEAAFGDIDRARDRFAATGLLDAAGPKPAPRKVDYAEEAVACLRFVLDAEPDGTAAETILVGYDDEYAIELFGTKLRAWWRRDGRLDGPGILALAMREGTAVRERAAAFDADLARRASEIAGPAYADLCALAWRHTIAAHKLCAGPEGQPLLFSKENFSNGCIATVDVTYPSAPLFLAFNPALLRAMIEPYFAYCASPAWPFPFAAHDLGTYPKANGQTYRGFAANPDQPILETQMPIEECGNMLILAGALQEFGNQEFGDGSADGDFAFVRRGWPLLAQWADYLVEAGADPGEQLCTDDFSGVLGHNVNLSAKAAMGLAAAARLAARQGLTEPARRYGDAARAYTAHLLAAARDGDGTRLAYDRPGSWSLKYNLVWDRLLGFDLVPPAERQREVDFYRTRAQFYGVPLDDRSSLTKPEWMLWAACLAPDRHALADFVDGIVRYANETPNRVPLSDLYFADSGRKLGFQARSVLGGLFLPFLEPRAPTPLQ